MLLNIYHLVPISEIDKLNISVMMQDDSMCKGLNVLNVLNVILNIHTAATIIPVILYYHITKIPFLLFFSTIREAVEKTSLGANRNESQRQTPMCFGVSVQINYAFLHLFVCFPGS